MKIVMKKSQILPLFKSKSEIARVLGITRQSVQGWGEILPESSATKLLVIYPNLPHQKIKNP